MSKPLRLLFVEDSEDDAVLLARSLERAGYGVSWERVDRPEALRGALIRGPWDAVLTDHSMPHFDSFAALALLKSTGIDVPFLVVSGSISEGTAVALMHAGAHDFVPKQDLSRLVPALEREMREAAVRAEARRGDRARIASEQRYRRFFEHDLTGVVLTDPAGRILDCNPAFRRIFGFASAAQAVGTDIQALWDPPEARLPILARLESDGRIEGYEGRFKRVDGASVLVVANIVGHFAEAGELTELATYVFDVTERKRLEDQYRQAQKMEVVGRLAGGVAHDFNNLLTAINGYAEMGILRAPPGDPIHRYLTEIRAAGERAAALTRRLLGFSRKEAAHRQVLDPSAVLRETEGMLKRLIGEDVALKMFLDGGVGPVFADRGHLEQVVMNLVVNARDAMPRGGALLVQTADVVVAPDEAGPDRDVPAGRYARLSVADTGCGMSPEVQARLFEPFFTTKDVGKGTGLGLATVRAIVDENGGLIRFTSEPGRGTEFRVYLPVVEGDLAEAAVAAAPPAPAATRGSETVLLVEDDPMVREFARDVLRDAGYAVLEARDGHEALEACRTHDGAIHVLVTDVVLPGMNGRDVAAQIAPMRPKTRVVFVSGYAPEFLQDYGLDSAGVAFLQKPFRAEDLDRKIRQVLAAGA